MLSPNASLAAVATYINRSRYPINNTEVQLGMGRWWTVHIAPVTHINRHFTAYGWHSPPCHRKWKGKSVYVNFCATITRYRTRRSEPW